jgi:hypothetical protein
MSNPACPFCKREMSLIADNKASIAWGCEPCLTYVSRAKPAPPYPEPGLTPIGQIAAPKVPA